MKFPSHIILDFLTPQLLITKNYWRFLYFKFFLTHLDLFSNLTFFNHFLKKKNLSLNPLILNQKQFTILYSGKKLHNVLFLFDSAKKKKKKKKITQFVKKQKLLQKFNALNVAFFLKHFNQTSVNTFTGVFFTRLFDINFLRKEKMYTKLKYSRVPQYDVVSGGSAALLAGFLGFLICEKFGFELIDSGDFYVLFMYLVFLFFFLRVLMKLLSDKATNWSFFSLKYLFFYVKTLIDLAVKKLKL